VSCVTMPGTSLPECAHYIPPPATKEDLDFADLAIIDLSKARTPEGRAELYPQVRDAFRTNGFIYAINNGYSQAQRDRIFDIADVAFSAVPPDEMKTYTANIEKVGYYQGYKARRYWKVDAENGVLDEIEHYGRTLMRQNKRTRLTLDHHSQQKCLQTTPSPSS